MVGQVQLNHLLIEVDVSLPYGLLEILTRHIDTIYMNWRQ